MRRLESFEWWDDLVKDKDDLSLRELAEKYGVTPGAISAAFRRTGTVRKPAPPGPRSRRKGDIPSLDGVRPGSKDSLILPYRDMLGDVPDSEVARKAGVSVRTIASYRARNNVPGFQGPRRRGQRAARGSKVDPFKDLLGQVPDRIVAEKAGVSINAVRNYRAKLGIEAAPRGSTPMPASRRATPLPAPTAGGKRFAWRVEGPSDRSGIVVASSLLEAAAKAERTGEVLRIERLGPVLG